MEQAEGHSDSGRPPISKYLYQLVIAQLKNDGYDMAAEVVSEMTFTPASDGIPEHRLAILVTKALEHEYAFGTGPAQTETDLPTGLFEDELEDEKPVDQMERGLNLDAMQHEKPRMPNLVTRFITTHKAPCAVAKFSGDGKLVATGSADTSIKILDVGKMISHSQARAQAHSEDFNAARPVIRTFYDHNGPVSDLCFHPRGSPYLISGSEDSTIKFFDLSKPSTKRSFRQIQDTHPVYSLDFHPTGDYLVVGTAEPRIHLYDVQTFTCFTSLHDHHAAPINQVRYHCEGSMYASCARDGMLKVWDGVSSKCVRNLGEGTLRVETTSVQFTGNGRYLLACGRDCVPRLWEVGTGRCVQEYRPHGPHVAHDGPPRMQCMFNHNEEIVMAVDEAAKSMLFWNAHTGTLLDRVTAGHHGAVMWLATSPTDFNAMTCSEDHRARFWTPENISAT